jgi:hypothetical protein
MLLNKHKNSKKIDFERTGNNNIIIFYLIRYQVLQGNWIYAKRALTLKFHGACWVFSI